MVKARFGYPYPALTVDIARRRRAQKPNGLFSIARTFKMLCYRLDEGPPVRGRTKKEAFAGRIWTPVELDHIIIREHVDNFFRQAQAGFIIQLRFVPAEAKTIFQDIVIEGQKHLCQTLNTQLF
jgi:hypothetical protein